MHIFIHALVCLALVCHLFLHHHCLLNPLSHYYCHALLNMSIYCYLIHGTKYFRRDWIFHIQFWNIQSGVTKNFVRGDKIWGDQIFHDRSLIEGTHFAYALFVLNQERLLFASRTFENAALGAETTRSGLQLALPRSFDRGLLPHSIPSLVPRHQIFRAHPAVLSKNRVCTRSLVKLGRNYTSVVACCRTN